MHYAALLLAAAAALPSVSSLTTLHTRNGRPVVETTTLPDGQVIDWVISDEVAPPTGMEDTLDELIEPLNGPQGAVPYFRPRPDFTKRVKKSPAEQQAALSKRSTVGHKYALTKQNVVNYGGGGSFSLYDPYLQNPNDDFSLIQTCVSNQNVYNSSNLNIWQTVEAGWQKYPSYDQLPVHLFTFFTTSGYNTLGDYIGGYNAKVKGWVQLDSNVAPGFSNWKHSVRGNASAQYAADLRYTLADGKWYLSVSGRNIGYYPASMFQNSNIYPGSSTLQGGADHIAFYGEIYSGNAQSSTNMGSGAFASEGYPNAAFIRNLGYVDTYGQTQDYWPDQSNDYVTDSSEYTLEKHFGSDSTLPGWGNYMFLGGPGYTG